MDWETFVASVLFVLIVSFVVDRVKRWTNSHPSFSSSDDALDSDMPGSSGHHHHTGIWGHESGFGGHHDGGSGGDGGGHHH